jgi:hypothetical protein
MRLIFYSSLGCSDHALEYCEQSLAISTELGIPVVRGCQKLQQELLLKSSGIEFHKNIENRKETSYQAVIKD